MVQLREWSLDLGLFSTRRPPARDRARHAFAGAAEGETLYLWPPRSLSLLRAVLWAAFGRPRRFLDCLHLAWHLPTEGRWHRIRTGALIPFACALARELLVGGHGHLHAVTFSNSVVIAMLVKRLTDLPYSVAVNANLEWWGGAIQEKLRESSFVVVHARWIGDAIRRRHPDLSDRVVLAPVGVDTRKWRPRDGEPRSASKPWQILSVGRIHSSKGHDLVIEAVGRLLSESQDVTLRILGDGPDRARLEHEVVARGLSGRISLEGSVSEDEIIRRMRTADIFVLASHAEPLGVAYMEAMSMAVPTIGTAAGGVGEIITDGVDGLLVPSGDVAALVAAIRRLLDDEGLRMRLGRAGRRKIVEQFDSRLGAATLYRALVGHEPPSDAPDSR